VLGRRPRTHCGGRAIGHVAERAGELPSPLPATLVAFYLPQFHPIAENDEWWGKGFTEWRNVTRALPQFEGHAQPRLPADLGYYDLRNAQTLRAQAALARAYGLGAFCFYFYWFDGKTLLEAPLRQWLTDTSLDFPFCLCWANENWTRRWDGRPGDTLVAQRHGPDDDIAFIEYVAGYLKDARYLRVDNKPVLLVYRPGLLPDARATAQRWRRWCADNGIGEIFIAYVQGFERPTPSDIGFDAAVEFPPNLSTPSDLTADQHLLNPYYEGQVLDWREVAAEYAAKPLPDYPTFPGVNCGWDNEPRRSGSGRTFLHASPRVYREWLQRTIEHRLAPVAPAHRLVFINAWNEWAEGAVLEPDTRLGHAWLQATRDALRGVPLRAAAPRPPCAVVHAWHLDAFEEILQAMQGSSLEWRLVVTTTKEKEERVRMILQRCRATADVHVAENRGRDILPFLRAANRLLDEGEDVVLKLHTKRSLHQLDGDRWRRELVSSLTSTDAAALAVQSFRDNPRLGLVVPEGHLQLTHSFRGANEQNVCYLNNRLGIGPMNPLDATFPAGSMFWARLEALRPLLDAHLDESEFEPEAGQVDGTFAHAVERIFAHSAKSAGYVVVSTSQLSTEPRPHVPPSEYRYARRD
jgi:lipopolysaccharide biosynthesis protein